MPGLGDTVQVELLDADPVQSTLRSAFIEHERGQEAELARAAWKKAARERGGRQLPRRGRR